MELPGRRIIVTGGASGIGASAVRAYVAAGASVVSLDVNDAAGAAVVAAANGSGGAEALYLHCDVSDRSEVEAVIERAVAALGGLDVLAHIAGVERSGPAEDTPDAVWDLMISVNATGTRNINQAVFPHLAKSRGAIINFASHAGVRGMVNSAAYSAAKGAVLAWTRALAQEWGRFGIAVNAVAPSIWTPMYDEYRSRLSEADLAGHDAAMRQIVPLSGKLGDADTDLAPFMVFLASRGAKYITGQTLPVDGGLLMLT